MREFFNVTGDRIYAIQLDLIIMIIYRQARMHAL